MYSITPVILTLYCFARQVLDKLETTTKVKTRVIRII